MNKCRIHVFAAYFDEDHEKDELTKIFTEGNIGNILALKYIGNILSSWRIFFFSKVPSYVNSQQTISFFTTGDEY